MALITCRDLSFAYDGNTALSGLDFQIDEGDFLCIVGENGSGKSTLLKGLLNLIPPLRGDILREGGFSPDETGYLPQQNAEQKYFPASVYEVVLSGCLGRRKLLPFYTRKDKICAGENMEKLGITSLRNFCYAELSGGQQQRALLARALCAARKILFLDEPAAGLDPLVTQDLYRVICDLHRSGMTIIMVSHNIHSAVKHARHILHLHKKQLFFGTSDAYKKTEIGMRFLKGEYNV